MNQKELKELIDFLIERDIAEFELERGDVKVRVKRGANAQVHAVAHHVAQLAPEEDLHTVKSPIVGTFYESPAPGAPPFVKPGDHVQAGQVLCIIEAMKLMNEIEADVGGEVVKRIAANGQ